MPKGIYIRSEKYKNDCKNRPNSGWFKIGHIDTRTEETFKKVSASKMGHFVSDETKLKISKSKIGCTSPNKGKPMLEHVKEKLRQSHLGKPAWNKGGTAWWAKGDKNVNWKGGITPLNHKIRTSPEYVNWRLKILQRDYFCCVNCGYRSKGKKTRDIVVDHIKPFSLYPELRFDINNGRTLCKKCDGILGYNYKRNKVINSVSF